MVAQLNSCVAKSLMRMNLQAASELRRGVGVNSVFRSPVEKEAAYWKAMDLADSLRDHISKQVH